MYYGEKKIEKPIRWAMVGGGKGSQIGYIHRSAAMRDFNFDLVAGAFDIDPERGREFGKQLHVDEDRCYPDYKCLQRKLSARTGSRRSPLQLPTEHTLRSQRQPCLPGFMLYVKNLSVLQLKRRRN